MGLIFSVSIVIKKWKKTERKDIKSVFSSICLLLMAITNVLAYWLDFLGVVSWGITIILLMFGAYFTKFIYLPSGEG